MKLGLIFPLAVFLVACDNPPANISAYSISACSDACIKGMRPMLRYNASEGCVCASAYNDPPLPAKVEASAAPPAPPPPPPAPAKSGD